MHPLIERRRDEIADICRRHRVSRLEVFGSGARAVDFDPQRSDVDFLVEFDVPGGAPTLKQYFELRDALTALLGRPVDLVMPETVANPFIKADIDRTREPLYAA